MFSKFFYLFALIKETINSKTYVACMWLNLKQLKDQSCKDKTFMSVESSCGPTILNLYKF